MDEQLVDQALVAVFNELIELGREAKQGAWVVQRGPVQDAISALMASIFSHASDVADQEAAIDGRSSEMISPSAHGSPSLLINASSAGGVVPLLLERARNVVADVRTRASNLSETDAAELLNGIADDLDRRVDELAKAHARIRE
jgi:hypothetical protein